MYGKNFPGLSEAEKIKVWEGIIKSSGTGNARVNDIMKNLGRAGKGIFLLSAAVATYEVLIAEDKGEALLREGAKMGGGFVGGAIGGAALGSFGGLYGAIVGVIAGGIAGALGMEVTFEKLRNCFS